MDNELKDNLIKSDLEVRYYEHVKKLLANKKRVNPEFCVNSLLNLRNDV